MLSLASLLPLTRFAMNFVFALVSFSPSFFPSSFVSGAVLAPSPLLPSPRVQWMSNFGYCGETSLITVAMSYGMHVSQFQVREIASNNTKQSQQQSQMLIGVNDYWTASQLKFTTQVWQSPRNPTATGFMSWVKQQVVSGSVVIVGVYENGAYLASGQDPDYDHIVPIIGWASNHSLDDPTYYSDDIVILSDNGLYAHPGSSPVFLFHISASSFLQSRASANLASSPMYSINGQPNSQHENAGIAITGIFSSSPSSASSASWFRVSLDTSVNTELPVMVDGSDVAPGPPANEVITVTVHDLQPGTQYTLYEYHDYNTLPETPMSASTSASASSSFTASNSTLTFSRTVSSSTFLAFRVTLANISSSSSSSSSPASVGSILIIGASVLAGVFVLAAACYGFKVWNSKVGAQNDRDVDRHGYNRSRSISNDRTLLAKLNP